MEVPEELQYQDQYEVELFSAPTSACPSPITRPSRRLSKRHTLSLSNNNMLDLQYSGKIFAGENFHDYLRKFYP